MGDLAIRVKGVSKRYDVFENPRSRLVHAFWPGYRDGMQEIWALRDIDFEVARGESVAVIGRNGGGKSTLLQILTGVLAPTSGEVTITGRVSALLELGSGFNPEYTGRDNVILNGMLLGLSREEILRRFEEIVAFAEIGEALDRPVKTYSSGMLMRLAFAVQVLTDPDILIIDEALSVGDFFFQQKCFAHIRSLCERGVTLVFVSHDMSTVRDLCGRAIYLKDGRMRFAGETRLAIRDYLAEGSAHAPQGSPSGLARIEPSRSEELEAILRDSLWTASPAAPGAGEGRLIAVAFYDATGNPSTSFRLGTQMTVKVAYRPKSGVETHLTLLMRNKFDQVVTAQGSSTLGLAPPCTDATPVMVFELSLDLLLEAGSYSAAISVGNLTLPNRGSGFDSSPALGPLEVRWDYEHETAPFLGMVGLPAQGTFRMLDSGTALAREEKHAGPTIS